VCVCACVMIMSDDPLWDAYTDYLSDYWRCDTASAPETPFLSD
jgi:hypothetical protein